MYVCFLRVSYCQLLHLSLSQVSYVVLIKGPTSFFKKVWLSSFPSTICWKDYSFPYWIVLAPLPRIFDFKVLFLLMLSSVQFSSVTQSCLFATPWIAACQASLSIINSQSLLKLMCIKLVMPSIHLILCHPYSSCPQSLPASGSFPVSQFFARGGQRIVVSPSASVLPMHTQDWAPLGWTGWVSLQSKGLSRVFSSATAQKHQLFGAQLSSHFRVRVSE